MEVKKQEEEDEGPDSQGEGKGKMGKGLPDVKTEEKAEVRLFMSSRLIWVSWKNPGKVYLYSVL